MSGELHLLGGTLQKKVTGGQWSFVIDNLHDDFAISLSFTNPPTHVDCTILMVLAPALYVVTVNDRTGVAPHMNALDFGLNQEEMTRTTQAKRHEHSFLKNLDLLIILVLVRQREIRAHVLTIG